MKNKFNLYFLLAEFSGLAIAWIDSQPTWDDTGITVLLILLASTLFGFLTFIRPWLIALAVSLWIPLWAIMSTHNYGALLAFIPGFAGAYAGYFIKYLISKK
ncbi:MAG: hypothetical protein PHT07_16730 [Paludibacter sp.]|nr:hypothetical protein [Paludibacter sp.]